MDGIDDCSLFRQESVGQITPILFKAEINVVC
jgi:hypothetical protein